MNNLIGLVPYSFSTTAHLAVVLSMSFTVVTGSLILGLSNNGLKFFSLFTPSGTPLALLPLLVIIEFISYLARPISLGLRLGANILSGHLLLTILSGFTYKIMTFGLIYFIAGLFPLAFIIAFSGLEFAIAFIQAIVFVILTCTYIKDGLELHSSSNSSSTKHNLNNPYTQKTTNLYLSNSTVKGNKCKAIVGIRSYSSTSRQIFYIYTKSITSYPVSCTRTYSDSFNNKIEPEKVYYDLLNNKTKVIKENKQKSGIYMWIHLKSNKKYIGSSKDISRRLYSYFSPYNLVYNKTMIICKSLIKYGLSEFSLSILEYCKPEIRIERENYYLKTLSPEYNILKEVAPYIK